MTQLQLHEGGIASAENPVMQSSVVNWQIPPDSMAVQLPPLAGNLAIHSSIAASDVTKGRQMPTQLAIIGIQAPQQLGQDPHGPHRPLPLTE